MNAEDVNDILEEPFAFALARRIHGRHGGLLHKTRNLKLQLCDQKYSTERDAD